MTVAALLITTEAMVAEKPKKRGSPRGANALLDLIAGYLCSETC